MCAAVGSAHAIDSARHATLGSQIVLDLYDCETDRLDDLPWMRRAVMGAARAAGATIVQTVFHRFAPWGISGVVVIAESHLAIHVWPENRYAAVDVFTCGDQVKTELAGTYLTRKLRSRRPVLKSFTRGDQAFGGASPAEYMRSVAPSRKG